MAKRVAILVAVIALLSALGFYFYPMQSQEPARPPRAHKVTLTWQQAARATSYNVYRRSDLGDPFEKLGNTTTTSYEDPKTTPGMRYCYAVTSVDPKGKESVKSQEMCVTIPHP